MRPLLRLRDLTFLEAAAVPPLMCAAVLLRTMIPFVSLPTLSRALIGGVARAVLHGPVRLLGVPTDRLPRVCALSARLGPAMGRCLVSSLLLYGCLKARGEDAAVCIGVRSTGPTFPAHAWVERAGIATDGTDLAAFAVLTRL